MNSTLDPYDELAAMFVTSETEATKATQVAVETTTELVLIGHLPVRAGLWLTPYADVIARESGPTGLVRLEPGRTSVQLLQASAELPMTPTTEGFDLTLTRLAGGIANWIIRVPQATTPDSILDARADRITLLSSANDAAVFEAYRQIKALVRCAEINRIPMPELGLVVVGADEHAARQMHEKLRRTIESFLNTDLPLQRVLPRMDATIATTRNVSFDLAEAPTLEQTVAAIGCAEAFSVESDLPSPDAVVPPVIPSIPAMTTPAPTTIPTPAMTPPPLPIATPALEETTEPELPELDRPARVMPFHPVASHRPEARSEPPVIESMARVKPARLTPKPAVEVEAKDETMSITEPQDNGVPVPLSNYVDGLSSLPIRCPDHERVELAVDEVGTLHLLGRDELLRDMKVVEAWAVKHRELIGMACPTHTINLVIPAVTHAFTDTPVRVSDLHASKVHLHLLAPVVVEGRQGWYAAPLNVV